MENRQSYFMRRAAQERSAANRALDPKARDAHLELAQRYQELVQSTGGAVEQQPAA